MPRTIRIKLIACDTKRYVKSIYRQVKRVSMYDYWVKIKGRWVNIPPSLNCSIFTEDEIKEIK